MVLEARIQAKILQKRAFDLAQEIHESGATATRSRLPHAEIGAPTNHASYASRGAKSGHPSTRTAPLASTNRRTDGKSVQVEKNEILDKH